MAPQQFSVGQNAAEIEVRDIQPAVEIELRDIQPAVEIELRDIQLVVEIELRDVVVQAGGEAIPVYEGAYEITPRVNGPVVLPTKDKRMNDDVTVKKIPQYEVSNEAGGKTFIVGDEYYG